MMERIGHINGTRSLPKKSQATAATGRKEPVFSRILEQARRSQELTFSAHARERLERRQIRLAAEDIGKLSEAVDKAAAKGAQSSLLIYQGIALLASVPNRTIITALDHEGQSEKVFTNIDSAIIIE